MSALASFLEFHPQRDWAESDIPTLVVAGGADRMTPQTTIQAVMARAKPPNVEVRVIPDAGHMLFHEHLSTTMRLLEPWLKQHLGQPAA